jgi:hypothetical protein
MIQLNYAADVLPSALVETPFGAVYRALAAVATTVWDPAQDGYRAGMAWGWYAVHATSELAGARDVTTAALVSAGAPLIKASQTGEELAGYLRAWRVYQPTYTQLAGLYEFFSAAATVRPISDPEYSAIYPVTSTRLAFYLVISDLGQLSVEEAHKLAVNASPLGSRPVVVLSSEGLIDTACDAVYGDVCIYAEASEPTGYLTTMMPVGGVLTATSDEVVEMDVPERMENGRIAFIGELRASVIPASGVVEEYAPPIIMLLGVWYSGGNFTTTFVTDVNRFNAMPIAQADADTATAFGLELNYAGTYGPYGAIQWSDNYEYEPLGVYLDINGENKYTDVDVDGLYCVKNESAGRSVAMCSHNNYWGSQVMTWRCRITKK